MAGAALCQGARAAARGRCREEHYPRGMQPRLGDLRGYQAGACIVMMSIILMKHYRLQQDKLSELANQLQEMAHLDPLTHIYNRRYLVEYLNKKKKIENQEFAVVLLDIDDFKSINDQYGHIYGDQTLQAFSDSMKKNMDNKGNCYTFWW